MRYIRKKGYFIFILLMLCMHGCGLANPSDGDGMVNDWKMQVSNAEWIADNGMKLIFPEPETIEILENNKPAGTWKYQVSLQDDATISSSDSSMIGPFEKLIHEYTEDPYGECIIGYKKDESTITFHRIEP